MDGRTLAKGRLDPARIPQGTITGLGTVELTMPELNRPAEIWLQVHFESGKGHNSWQFYCFPKSSPRAQVRSFATPAIHSSVQKLYPETKLLEPQPHPDSQHLLFADRLDETVLKFVGDGGTVLLLGLADFSPIQPGASLGWWMANDQRGTAMAESKAFGDFPGKDGLPSFAIFGLLHDAVLLQGPLVNHIDPLMVTLSKRGYSVSVFETRVGSGRLFATGLNLLSGTPGGTYLLDQFVSYSRTRDFTPRRNITVTDLRAATKRSPAVSRKNNISKRSIA
jgi:hypothetical protein